MTPFAAYLITQDILEQRRRQGERARSVRRQAPRRRRAVTTRSTTGKGV